MTYIRRAVKYLIQLILIFVVLIGILMLAGMIPVDVALAFMAMPYFYRYILYLVRKKVSIKTHRAPI